MSGGISTIQHPERKDHANGEVMTGTTIMAVPCKDGVVVCADSRTSSGTYVVSRTTDKLVQLSKHIYCCRSGSAADTQALTDYVHYYLSQVALETRREPTVKMAAHLMRRFIYNNKDNLVAGVIIAGWDSVDGGSIYKVTQGGTCLKVPFALGGSGSIFITSFVDSSFKLGMTSDEARAFVKKAVALAMCRDGSSGGCIRSIIITKDGTDRDYTPGDQLPYGPAQAVWDL